MSAASKARAARALAEAHVENEAAKRAANVARLNLTEAERAWTRTYTHDPVTVRLDDGSLVTIQEAENHSPAEPSYRYTVSQEVTA